MDARINHLFVAQRLKESLANHRCRPRRARSNAPLPRKMLPAWPYGCLLLVIVAVSLSAWGGQDGEPTAATKAGGAVAKPAVGGNWNFETGDFTGWRTRSSGSGAWHVYADGTRPPDPADSDQDYPFKVPDPPEGRFAAVTDMSAPGTRILYRDVRIDRRLKLRFTLYYVNSGAPFSSPKSLDFERRQPNQQFRVDLIDPAAPVDSLVAKDVLARIFATARRAPAILAPKAITFDLSRWAGKRVRLRFAQVDNRGPLRAGVDDLRLVQAGPSPEQQRRSRCVRQSGRCQR